MHRLADDPNATKLCHEVELVSTRFITTSRPEEGSNQTNRIIKIRDYTLSPFFHYYRVQIKMKYLPFQSNFSFSISNKTPSTSPTTRPIFSFPLLSPIRPFIVLHSILHVAFSSRSSNLFRKLEGFVNLAIIKRGIWVGGVAELGRRYILDGCLIVDGLVTIERYPRPLLIMAPRWRYFGCRPKINKLMPDSKRRQGRDGSRAN